MKREVCSWCDEPIVAGERVMRGMNFINHHECGMRSVIGGVNHLKGKCRCCGGTLDPDPPGFSRRAAARLAVKAWEELDAQNKSD